MAITQLTPQHVQPNLLLENQQESTFETRSLDLANVLTWQPRIDSALSLFCKPDEPHYTQRFMLLKAPESELFFSLFQDAVSPKVTTDCLGFSYHVNETKITLNKAKSKQDNFATKQRCIAESWVDSEKLFGCVRQPENGNVKLQAGLVHDTNGGILILGLRSLLSQPQNWYRLKRMIIKKEFDWFSNDESHPLPLTIPTMPLDLRVILVGDRISLAELQEMEPDLYTTALYSEFENELPINSADELTNWLSYLAFIAQSQKLPTINASAYPQLVKESVRYTGDQYHLPLSLDWLCSLLVNASHFAKNEIDDAALKHAISQKKWRESYLFERFREEFFSNQISINTKDQVVGQINGLSVIEYPGYPRVIGEPTRISCLVHFGDGELVDIERKTELAGNIHSKGMMIMQAFIMSEFAINHQLPFSTSLVFEQSYSEVDGDSASLTGLCVLMSALSGQTIDQQIAVTGSVDQFGHVQPIGGVNEKIEGFFAVCQHQGLTGQQGVIIPTSNLRHLCLSDEVIDAIAQDKFSILTVDHIAEALYLLTGIPYKDENEQTISLYKLIQFRMQQLILQDKRSENWLSRLRKCCKK